MGSSSPALSNMQFLVLLSAVAVAFASPIPEEGAEAPVALAYVHDATGDVADDASPAAEPYVHDATGDVAVAYVHEEPVVAPVAVAPPAVAPVTYAAYPYHHAYPYAVAAYHTGCVNNLAAWCPAPKSFNIETKRPTEDRKGQRTTREQ